MTCLFYRRLPFLGSRSCYVFFSSLSKIYLLPQESWVVLNGNLKTIYSTLFPSVQKGKLRTGSIGSRSADEMIQTLVEPKKSRVSSVRTKLLALGLEEEVEFDPINIEPVLVYSLRGDRRVFVKHKWATIALVRLNSREQARELASISRSLELEENEQDGTIWFKFDLPEEEATALKALAEISV
jgi:hypothetical protein